MGFTGGRKDVFLAAVAVLALAVLFVLYEVFSFSPGPAGAPQENLFFISETAAYPSMAEISSPLEPTPSLGFAPDTEAINFGVVPSGGNYATKFIDVSNGGTSRVLLLLNAEGDIRPYVSFERAKFVLAPKDSSRVSVRFVTGENTPVGNYIGRIYVSKVVAKNPVAGMFLMYV